MEQLTIAIEFFEEEIRQYDIMLAGVLSPEYANYIQKKKEIYKLALASVRKLTKE